jgi:phosphoribosylformylglycinamidine synthase
MRSWEIFLSESQERMVLAVAPDKVGRIEELARIYETEAVVIGEANDSGRLVVTHGGTVVCDLDGEFLHEAPRKHLQAEYRTRVPAAGPIGNATTLGPDLRALVGSFNLCSREPIIREYDHEVQGNTLGKPLAGPAGDNPQDAAVIDVEGSGHCIALGISLLPRYDALDPRRMGLATVDEAIRQLVATGADPDAVGILDNFCMGDPTDPAELGRLVETCKGISEAALGFGAPFISGKDSFYNTYRTDEGPIHIPVTILVSSIGLLRDRAHITGATLRGAGNLLCLLGQTADETGGSAYANLVGNDSGSVPAPDPAACLNAYRRFHLAVRKGWILSAHDLSEGGLAVAAAEMGYGLQAGIELDLDRVPQPGGLAPQTLLFSESGGRILFEVDPSREDQLRAHFAGLPFAVVGHSVERHRDLHVTGAGADFREPLSELKALWKNGLTPYY